MQKFKLIILFVFLAIYFVQAQQIALIHRDSVLLTTPHYTEKIQSVDSVQKVYTQELESLQKSLEGKYVQLLQPYRINQNEPVESIKQRMSPADTLRFNILLDEDKALQVKAKSYDNMVRFLYEQDVRPILNKVDAVIKSYCEKNKIDMVLYLEQMQPAMAYLNPKRNITREIISLISKN